MPCTVIRLAFARKNPPVFGHSEKPRSGCLVRRVMVRFHVRMSVTHLILLRTIFAGCYVSGGSEGLTELASQSSVDRQDNVFKQIGPAAKDYVGSAQACRLMPGETQ